MAFLDKLSSVKKTVAKGAATAADKAGDAIGSGKVALKILREENTIDEQYQKIGAYFYAQRNAGMELPPEIEAYCVAVDVAKASIVELKEERQEYRDAPEIRVESVEPPSEPTVPEE